MIKYFLLMIILWGCTPQGPVFDKSVQRDLKSLEYPYQIDDDGDFLVFQLLDNNNRKQNVWVSSERHSINGVVFREVFSLAKEYEGIIPIEVANSLLIQNYGGTQLGFWSVLHVDTSSLLLYVVRIPVKNQKNWLKAAIDETATAADGVELLLSKLDEY